MSQLTSFFKILSDETRLRIIALIAQQELCVCEICGVLKLSQPKVSKHLAKLRDKGFVSVERKEQFIFYSLKIEDDVLEKLVMSILDNIDKYSQLSMDSKRLIDKDRYSDKCNKDGVQNLN